MLSYLPLTVLGFVFLAALYIRLILTLQAARRALAERDRELSLTI